MKTFSKNWISSKNPNKQRKYRFNAPLHIKRKLLSSPLSKDLRNKYGRRAVPVVRGDKVKIMTGSFKGKTGTVSEIMVSHFKIFVDCAFTTKKSGSKSFYPMDASNVMIIELNTKDSVREKSIVKEAPVVKKVTTKKTTTKASEAKEE
ncbi:50S ribosomal protein L24 [Candidatus Woesearchaeota archaeon]|nr:50S ribosomal protein L24 [Candidatus Woesearchaeota archaeon]